MRLDRFAQEIVQAANQQVAQEILDLIRGVNGLGSRHFADEQLGIVDLDGIDAESAQADIAQFGILEADRLLGAPFQIQEGLEVDEIDLGLETGI